MYCKKCGNELTENTKFCEKCGEPVEQTPTTSTKKNKTLIIVAIVLVLVIVGLSLALVLLKKDKKTSTTDPDTEQKEDNKDKEDNEPSEEYGTLDIYSSSSSGSDYFSEEMLTFHGTSIKLSTYACKTEDCYIVSGYTSENSTTIVVYDSDFYFYDYKTKKSQKINLGDLQAKLETKGEWGLKIEPIKINDKTYYLFKCRGCTPDLGFYGLIDSSGNIVISEEASHYEISKKDNSIYYTTSEDYKNDSSAKFNVYNTSTKKLTESKSYKQVALIENGYVGVIDNDNNLKILDINENTIVKLAELENSMYIYEGYNGLWVGISEDGDTISISVEDPSVTKEDVGEIWSHYGYSYSYTISTGKIKKTAVGLGQSR